MEKHSKKKKKKVKVNKEWCKGCGICVARCQMEALTLEDDKVVLDLNHCIGCGLCVTTCSTGSLTLVRKPDPEQSDVPRNMFESLYKLARVRKKINPLREIKMKIQSRSSAKKKLIKSI